MAAYFFDTNGSTAGFGTLTGAWNTTSALWTTSTTGTATPTAVTFNSNDLAQFGFAGTSATAGTITIADGVTVTLNRMATASDLAGLQTITRTTTGALILAGASPFIAAIGAGGLTISAPIGGTTAWTSSGAGVLTLTAANGFSGGMTISAGTLRVGNASALGSGTVTITGGKLSSDSTTARSLANNIVFNGTMTLGDATNNGPLTFTSASISVSGTTSLTVGTGTAITISGALIGSSALSVSSISGFNAFVLTNVSNNYSGAFSLTSGAIRVGGTTGETNQLASAASIALSSGTTLWYTGTTNTTISNSHTGSGAEIVVWRDGILTFAGSSLGSFTGPVTHYREGGSGTASTIQFSTNTAFPSSGGFKFLSYTSVASTMTTRYTGTGNVSNSGTITLDSSVGGNLYTIDNSGASGANLTLSGTIQSITTGANTNTLALGGTSTGTTTLSGNITDSATGTTNLSKTSSGTLTLTGTTSTYKGSVTVSTGTLNANSATALGATSSTAAISVTSSLGAGVLSLGAAVTYASKSLALSGALVLNHTGTSTFSSVTLASSSYIRGAAAGSSALAATIANGGFTLTAGAASGVTLSLTSAISGTGGLTIGNAVSDPGKVALPVGNTYQGNTTLSFGTLSLGNAAALGTGVLIFNGAALDVSTPLTVTNGLTVSANITFTGTAALTLSANAALGASRTVTVNGSTLTLSGIVSGATYKLTKAGVGTLALTNAGNTYSGGTDVNAGTLTFASGGLGSSGTVAVNSAALQWASGNTDDISARLAMPSVGGYAEIDIGSNNVSFFSAIGNSGSAALYKSGSGILSLLQVSTYTGLTTIAAGTLRARNANALAASSQVYLPGAGSTLQAYTLGGQNGKLTVKSLNNVGGTIKIGGIS